MGGTSASTMPGDADAARARYARLHQLASPLQVQTDTFQRSGEARHEGPGYAADAGYRMQSDRTVISDQTTRKVQADMGAEAYGSLMAAKAGHADMGSQSSVDGAVVVGTAADARLAAQSSYVTAPNLVAGQAQIRAEAAAQLKGGAIGQATLGNTVTVLGGLGVEGEASARACAQGAFIMTPQLVGAQVQLLAEAAARIRATASGQACLAQAINVGARASVEAEAVSHAVATGSVIATPTHFVAEGQAEVGALARVREEVAGHVDAGPGLAVNAATNTEVAAGAVTSADGLLHLGTDAYGMPDFGIGGSVGAASGAWAKAGASGDASILGLIRIGVSGSAQAIAGLAGGLGGKIHYHDGAITVGMGATAAAGVGGGGDASVTIGLGKLPGGILQTVGAPILPLPGLIVTSIVRGVRAIAGSKGTDPTAGSPGIEDFPKVVVNNVSHGISLIGEGAKDMADQVVDVSTRVAKGVADGAVAVGKGVASVGSAIGKGVADGATAVWHGITHLFG